MKYRQHPYSGSVNTRDSVRSLPALLLAAGCTQILAGGLYRNEFGTPAMGTSGAGAQALANDASTDDGEFQRTEPSDVIRCDQQRSRKAADIRARQVEIRRTGADYGLAYEDPLDLER